jgi:hypothetical protein
MPGLVPGIHVFLFKAKTWMAGTKPGHDDKEVFDPTSRARSCFGLTRHVFLRAFSRPDSALDNIYLH